MAIERGTTTTAFSTSTSSGGSAGIQQGESTYLKLTLPSLFRCPISMDVMKSPVSLCTGVTYDRTSIQAWLSQGHNTCPATMQVLPSTDFTPNLTLRRLISLYQQHVSSPVDLSPTSSPHQRNSLLLQQEALRVIKSVAAGEENLSLMKVLEFVKFSDENRRFIASTADAVSDLVEILRKSDTREVTEQIILILQQISSENGVKEFLNLKFLRSAFDYLSQFIRILREGSLNSRIASAKILELIAYDADSQRKIAAQPELLHELYKLGNVETATDASVEAILSALIAISTSKAARKELLRLRIVQTAAKILSRPEPGRVVTEKALEILVSIARCTDGRSAIIEDQECITGIVKRLMKCSGEATEHGIMVLWSLCCLARDRTAQDVVAKVNGLAKVLVVMQSDCSAGVREMCGELVKALTLRAKNSKSCLASYDTKTTHIMPY